MFGIGQPSNSQPGEGAPTVQTANADEPPADGDNGGDTGTVRPPR